MNKNPVLIAVIALLVGFIGGFWLANSLNRRETAGLAASNSDPSQPAIPATGQTTGPPLLTPEEIKAKIDAADKNPNDFSFQKSLGLSLYRYASLKQDASLLPDTIRIMQRAFDLDAADRDLQIGLGNAHFDVGYFDKDNASFERAREFYNRALARVPTDVDVRTDLALTYYLQDPPDLARAVEEFEKGLEINPKHERSLQFLIQTHVKQNDTAKASAVLERLKSASPSNPAIAELTSLVTGGPAAQK